MAIRPALTFYGTGRPMNPFVNPRVNREPSRMGILYSGVRTKGEFNRTIKERRVPDINALGKGAVKLQKSLGISVNVTI